MKADIAIDQMIVILVAVIAAGMLIALAFGKLPELARSISCSAHSLMNALIPEAGGLSPTLPEYCTPARRETPKIEKSENDTMDELAAYILDCWEKGERGNLNDTFSCNQLSISSTETFAILPQEIVNIFIKNDLCSDKGIQDNSSGCGTKQQINWTKTSITNKDFVLIEYAPGKVVVR